MNEPIRSVDDIKFDFGNNHVSANGKDSKISSTLLMKSTDFVLKDDNEPENDNNEWSAVPTIEAKFSAIDTYQNDRESAEAVSYNLVRKDEARCLANASVVERITINEQTLINFDHLCQNLNKFITPNENWTEVNAENDKRIKLMHRGNVVQRVCRKMFGPPKLNKNLVESFNMVNLLATKQLDDSTDLQKQMLFTIYKRLTGTDVDCPRFGSHWENIGFQGNDPATDLRGCGILSLFLTIYLFEPTYLKVTQDIYKLSLNDTQNFPFCVMGINLVRIMLQVMRKNLLNCYFNKATSSLFEVCGRFYMALFLELYLKWKNNNKTIRESGFVLRDLETKANKSPKGLINQLSNHLKSMNKPAFKYSVPKIVIEKAESVEFSPLD